MKKIEIFSAGCALCQNTIDLINKMACPSCEVTVLSMSDPETIRRAKELGVNTVPAVVIDGKLASCCANRGPDEAALRAAGVGKPA